MIKKFLLLLIILITMSSCTNYEDVESCDTYSFDSYDYLNCVSSKELSADCESVTKQENKNLCWQYELRRKSIELNDKEICLEFYDKITDYPIMYVNMCLEQYAIAKVDPLACELVDPSENPSWGKARCYVNLAEEFNDVSYCEFINESQKVEDIILPEEEWMTMREYCRQL